MSQRASKRNRKKESRRARIEEQLRREAQARRKRMAIRLSALVLVAAVGAFFFIKPQESKPPDPCGGPTPSPTQKPTFNQPPPMEISPDVTYTAVVETTCGRIDMRLAAQTSPNTVNSFVFLARQGFYDGLKFHRVVPEFAVQGGDPKGDGTGGPGYSVVDVPPADFTYTRGTVAMAKGATEPPGTSSSQFFIVPGREAEERLPPEYAVLGEVVRGMDVVRRINRFGTENLQGQSVTPTKTAYITKITIREG